jgi:ribosome biogenesis GTPase
VEAQVHTFDLWVSAMSTQTFTLPQLGWRPSYSQQLTIEDLEAGYPARVAIVQRSLLTVLSESGEQQVQLPDTPVTVGDWVLVRTGTTQTLRVLERQSLIARIAAGTEPRDQLIAANVDTLLIVTSCNADFNLSRLERYLAIAHEARVTPVVVLTKADLCTDVPPLLTAAQGVAADVVALNATDPIDTLATLSPWLARGQTLALVGSSGVGKSTLLNSVLGTPTQTTAAIREADSKGRHTTTARHLISTPAGAWLIDTPGMRELRVGALTTGIAKTFTDLETLATQCRFRDCSHNTDEGCALRAAVERGHLDARRLTSYLKLEREANRAAQTLWERHKTEKRFGRMARAAQRQRRKETGRE